MAIQVSRGTRERMNRARVLVDSGAVIPLGDGWYSVASQTGSGCYRVHVDGECNCPDHEQGETCKHIYAARLCEWQ